MYFKFADCVFWLVEKTAVFIEFMSNFSEAKAEAHPYQEMHYRIQMLKATLTLANTSVALSAG